jgi:hypothetical protein
MAQEPFLINPPKRLRRKVKVHRRSRRRNPIGETLTIIGANPMAKNPWYGNSEGHRIAALMRWGKVRRGKIRVGRKRRRVKAVHRVVRRKTVHRKRTKRGRWAPAAVRLQRKLAVQSFWADKYGEMLAHPRRKKYHYKTRGVKYYMKRLRRRRKTNSWFGQPRRHRKAARKGWRKGHLISAGKRRRRVRHHNFFTNPAQALANPRRRKRHHAKRRRHSVRHRRNPAIMAEFGKFSSSIMNIREWAPLAITGGLSAITGAVVPGMLGVYNPYVKYGVQTALAIGGGLVVERVVDKRHGQAWMIVGVAMVGYQLLKEYVLVPYFPQFAVGLGDYQDYYPTSPYANADETSQQVGAFTPQLSAFPGVSDYPGVGSYPYDGAGY